MKVKIPKADEVLPGRWSIEFESVMDAVLVASEFGSASCRASAGVIDESIRSVSRTNWVDGASLSAIATWMSRPKASLIAAFESARARICDVVAPPGRPKRKVRRNMDSGDELDPQAAAERRTDGWSATVRSDERRKKRVVSVALNMSVASFMQREHLLSRGATAAALADVLTGLGCSVEVIGFMSVSNMSDRAPSVLARVTLKAADAPLDVGSLSTAAAEIGFFRMVMMHATARSCPGVIYESFGLLRTMSDYERRGFDAVIDSDVLTEEAAVASVMAFMTKESHA